MENRKPAAAAILVALLVPAALLTAYVAGLWHARAAEDRAGLSVATIGGDFPPGSEDRECCFVATT
ncbi:MAG: hypothetical protein L0211_08370 [Planctomycetaceae bacterium]|nr:hypothetical protein [Planctomycetaceae bacterium]